MSSPMMKTRSSRRISSRIASRRASRYAIVRMIVCFSRIPCVSRLVAWRAGPAAPGDGAGALHGHVRIQLVGGGVWAVVGKASALGHLGVHTVVRRLDVLVAHQPGGLQLLLEERDGIAR